MQLLSMGESLFTGDHRIFVSHSRHQHKKDSRHTQVRKGVSVQVCVSMCVYLCVVTGKKDSNTGKERYNEWPDMGEATDDV